jgi:hypothetical protein
MLADFYLEPVTQISVHYLYTSPNNEVESYTMDTMSLEPFHVDKSINKSCSTIIPPDFLVKTLELRHFKDGHNYKLQTLLRFVIDLAPEDMSDFVADLAPDQDQDQDQDQEHKPDQEHKDMQTKFLQTVNYLKPVSYPAVINIFTDLSALYVIFKRQAISEDTESTNNFTRKIKLSIPTGAGGDKKEKRKGKRTVTKKQKHKLYVEKA